MAGQVCEVSAGSVVKQPSELFNHSFIFQKHRGLALRFACDTNTEKAQTGAKFSPVDHLTPLAFQPALCHCLDGNNFHNSALP